MQSEELKAVSLQGGSEHVPGREENQLGEGQVPGGDVVAPASPPVGGFYPLSSLTQSLRNHIRTAGLLVMALLVSHWSLAKVIIITNICTGLLSFLVFGEFLMQYEM